MGGGRKEGRRVMCECVSERLSVCVCVCVCVTRDDKGQRETYVDTVSQLIRIVMVVFYIRICGTKNG